jgi:putative FmdB family regulatory protein
MPTYEYACRSCDRVIEVFQSMRDAPLTECPQCGQPGVKRLIGRGAGIIFKGSGFYETDYKRQATDAKGGGDGGKADSGGGGGADSGGTSTPASTSTSTSSTTSSAAASTPGTSGAGAKTD